MIDCNDSFEPKRPEQWLNSEIRCNDPNSTSPDSPSEPACIVKIRALTSCNDKQQVLQCNVIDQSFYMYNGLFDLTWGCLALNNNTGGQMHSVFQWGLLCSHLTKPYCITNLELYAATLTMSDGFLFKTSCMFQNACSLYFFSLFLYCENNTNKVKSIQTTIFVWFSKSLSFFLFI